MVLIPHYYHISTINPQSERILRRGSAVRGSSGGESHRAECRVLPRQLFLPLVTPPFPVWGARKTVISRCNRSPWLSSPDSCNSSWRGWSRWQTWYAGLIGNRCVTASIYPLLWQPPRDGKTTILLLSHGIDRLLTVKYLGSTVIDAVVLPAPLHPAMIYSFGLSPFIL